MNKRLSLCAFALLAGCAVGPDYHRPSLDVPAQYHDVAPTTSDVAGDAASTGDSGWWEVYADADLQALLATALKNNYDVKIAVARIDAARAQLGSTLELPAASIGRCERRTHQDLRLRATAGLSADRK